MATSTRVKKKPIKKNRKLDAPAYSSFRLQKRIRNPKPKLPSVRTLWRQTWQTLKTQKRYFLWFILVYGVISFLFIQLSVNPVDVNEAKTLLQDSLGGLPTDLAILGGLVGSSSQFTNPGTALYQFIIVIIFSLAGIYALRHMYGDTAKKMTIKESLYKGMTPLIPLLIVLFVIALQLVPLSIGSSIYSIVVTNGLAVTILEQVLWFLFIASLILLSLYLISSSFFALFIVTLPDMAPWKSLRMARDLVRHRRLEIIRKIIVLPIVLIVLITIVVLPFIALWPAAAQTVLFLVSLLILPIALVYMYNLYRSML